MTQIVKADGSHEKFREEKLRRSLKRAGATKEEIADIVRTITTTITDGMSTQEIYRHAFELLRKTEVTAAARYSLRRALFGLGPTGFPFEDFLTRLFQLDGYSTKTRTMIHGKCVRHELDIAAYKKDHSFVAEAKFHARPGIKSDLQVAMYSYARLLDLKEIPSCHQDTCGIKELWIITNTKFTSAAERYAECVGIQLLSWDYPRRNTLHDRIEKHGIYPITVLQNLSTAQKRMLLERKVILCGDILKNPHILRHLHISKSKFEAVVSEARQLCKHS